ncbi:MAG: hypothetical protein ACRERU_21185, partial [Methylococcales bacterium]
DVQRAIPSGAFSEYLEDQLTTDDLRDKFSKGVEIFDSKTSQYRKSALYSDWFMHARKAKENASFEGLRDLYQVLILIAREEAKRQRSFDCFPLPSEVLEDTDSKIQGAAETFLHEDLKIPFYYGVDRLCVLATNNVEELLSIATALYEGMQAKQVLRTQLDPRLSPREQESRIKEVTKRKHNFIPKNHSEGTRAQTLLDAIGSFCREKTFQLNAPYAPGVTGVRLRQAELNMISADQTDIHESFASLRRVLAECVAENLLTTRKSSATTSRDSGTVFYLNRTLCVYHGLPLQYGGWQDVSAKTLIEWMERMPRPRQLSYSGM